MIVVFSNRAPKRPGQIVEWSNRVYEFFVIETRQASDFMSDWFFRDDWRGWWAWSMLPRPSGQYVDLGSIYLVCHLDRPLWLVAYQKTQKTRSVVCRPQWDQLLSPVFWSAVRVAVERGGVY